MKFAVYMLTVWFTKRKAELLEQLEIPGEVYSRLGRQTFQILDDGPPASSISEENYVLQGHRSRVITHAQTVSAATCMTCRLVMSSVLLGSKANGRRSQTD